MVKEVSVLEQMLQSRTCELYSHCVCGRRFLLLIDIFQSSDRKARIPMYTVVCRATVSPYRLYLFLLSRRCPLSEYDLVYVVEMPSPVRFPVGYKTKMKADSFFAYHVYQRFLSFRYWSKDVALYEIQASTLFFLVSSSFPFMSCRTVNQDCYIIYNIFKQ